VRQFLLGLLVALALLAGIAAWLWYRAPEHLPLELRRDNPHSRDYAPKIYRWKDAAGRTQLTDSPPADRPYETIRIDPDTNVVPDTLPREADVRGRR
jgi:hypothetical protein